jgi:hypothetical protein
MAAAWKTRLHGSEPLSMQPSMAAQPGEISDDIAKSVVGN